MLLEKTLESPLDCKEIQPVHPKGNQSWIFFGSTDAEVEALVLWPLMGRTDSLEKTPILGKIEGRRRRGRQRMRWMASLTQWTWVWASSGSWWWTGSLACRGSWGRKESDMTEWLNWTELIYNAVLVSGVQHSDSVIHIHVSILFQILFPFRLFSLPRT